MRRPLALLTGAVVLTVAAGSVVVSGAVATDTTPQITAAQTLHLIAATDRQQSVDVPPAGFSLADQQVFAGQLTAPGGADRGRFDVACTATDTLAGGSLQCLFTLALPGGLLTAHGLASAVGPRSTAAVTGGTRRYQNVRGQILVEQSSATIARLTVSLLP